MTAAAREADFRARISDDVWDVTAWQGLVNLAAEIGDLDKQREVYEALLAQFPFAVCPSALNCMHACIPAYLPPPSAKTPIILPQSKTVPRDLKKFYFEKLDEQFVVCS